MKYFLVAACLLLGLITDTRAQQMADDKFITIYSLIQSADRAAGTGQPQEALTAYTDAQAQLEKFNRVFPEWNPAIINYRRAYIAGKIAELKGQVTAPKVVPPTATPSADEAEKLRAQIEQLNSQLQSAQTENTTLQDKLKEALAVQPATIDPVEFARAQEQIRSLMKENDLLKVTRPQPEKIIVTDTNALAQARQELADYTSRIAAEHDRAEKLATDTEKLRGDLATTRNSSEALATLNQQNTLLKDQITALQGALTNSPNLTPLTAELADARAHIAALKSAAAASALEKAALEQRLTELANAPKPDLSGYESRLRKLTQERDDLQKKLDATSKKNSRHQEDQLAAQVSALNDEVKTLQSRLSVAEAKPVPYSAEELALFRQPAPAPHNPEPIKKPISEMPAGSAELVASAQQHFSHHEFDQAEADYLKILERDQNNGLALANLATIELQEDKLDAAEKHIAAAVAQSPDDAYNLSTLGYLKFRQEKYDDALNVLSRAAQIDPNNPEIQNYLGVTLSHKGQRVQGETALRKAIQLNPNYAPAHNNLAVIYLNQDPPLPQLARWHYQKALEAGQPPNPDLEKILAAKGAPVAP